MIVLSRTQDEFDEDDRKTNEILENLNHIFPDKGIVELRIIGPARPIGGMFVRQDQLAQFATAADDDSEAFVGINLRKLQSPTELDEVFAGKSPEGTIVPTRQYFFLDVDPVRLKKCCATDAELAFGSEVFRRTITWLQDSEGWPAPIECTSGNGYHALFRIDIEAEDEGLIQCCLIALAQRFDTPQAKIDRCTHDAKRLIRIPGTTNRKGKSTLKRPHRPSKLLANGSQQIVSRQKLELLAKEAGWVPPADSLQVPAISVTPRVLTPVLHMITDVPSGATSSTQIPDPQSDVPEARSPAADLSASESIVAQPAKTIESARAWVAKQESAVEGRQGDRQTYLVALGIVTRFDLSNEDAMVLLIEYNQRCDPPWSEKELAHKLDCALQYKAKTIAAPQPPPAYGRDEEDRESLATKLSRAILDVVEIWKTPSGKPYLTVEIEGQVRHLSTKSSEFRDWVIDYAYEMTESATPDATVTNVVNTVNARARQRGKTKQLFVRVAGEEDRLVIDLANKSDQAVEVTPGGWSIIKQPSEKFYRSPLSDPLPLPTPQGNIDALREFVSVSDSHFKLIVGFILAALRGNGPFPILAISGDQGSGKSTLSRVIRSLIDPSHGGLRSLQGKEQDFAIQASRSAVIVCDNISSISNTVSDTLCRASTGGAHAARQLYTDDEETVIEYCRPCILNGIGDLLKNGDLIERCFIVEALRPTVRIDPDTYQQKFEQAAPGIFGAICDALVASVGGVGQVKINDLPRMGGVAKWVTAAESTLGWQEGEFLEAYRENLNDGQFSAIDQSLLTGPLQKLMDSHYTWTGSPSDLFKALTGFIEKSTGHRPKEWPGSPSALSKQLQRLKPDLHSINIRVTPGRRPGGKRTRTWTVEHIGVNKPLAKMDENTPDVKSNVQS